MAKEAAPETLVQLATRVPWTLHRRVKLHCIEQQESMMEFVVRALEARLGGKKKARPKSKPKRNAEAVAATG